MPLLHEVLRRQALPVAHAVSSQRLVIYGALSTLAVIAVITNACRNHSNFYSVTIYLGRSGRSVVFLANFCCLLALLCGRVVQRIFFGSLQPREVERLYDQTWMFVTESLLAFTIFRDEFDIPFGVMFGFLLFIKCFHWLMSDRIESMDQVPYPGPSILFHFRMVTLFAILWMVDLALFALAMDTTLNVGVGGMVLFANEYAILMANALNSIAKYFVNLTEFRRARNNGGENAPPWEDKSMYVFYIELVTDFLKLMTYLTFFVIIVLHYGLPLNMIRDVYVTARSFFSRFRALLRYRTATRDMDRRYQDATEEELAAMSDRTCIICRDEMVAQPARQPNNSQAAPNTTPKKLPCGHMFHFNCLRSWLERQQSCPTCRRTVLDSDPAPRPGQALNGRRPAGQRAGAPIHPFGLFGAPQQPVQQRGLLRRFFNVAAQPPPVPGQGGNGFVPGVNPGQNVGGWGQLPQQPHPYGPFMYPYQPPPQQLQHPPPFPGFYGPGGAWQPWGLDPQVLGEQQRQQQQQQQQPQPQRHQSQPPHLPAQASNLLTATPEPRASPSAAPNPSSTNTSFIATTGAQNATASRDAAVAAALRRLDSRASSSGSSSTSVATASFPSPGTETRQGGSSSSSTVPSVSNSNSASTTTNGIPSIPALIPLTDFGAMFRGSFINSSLIHQPMPGIHPQHPQNAVPRQTSQVESMPVPPNPLEGSSTQTQTSIASSPLPNQGSSSSSDHPPQQQQQGSSLWPQLPDVLTDDQLSRMDVLTREAIDERLRVLGRVDEIVNTCIEELIRVRSVLPPTSDIGASTSTAVNEVTPSEGGVSVDSPGTGDVTAANESSEKARGKEKARRVFARSASK